MSQFAPGRPLRPSSAILVVVVVTLLAGVIAGQAVSQARQGARPSRVAVVELPRVVDGLEQRSAMMAEIQGLADDFNAEDKNWQSRIEAVTAELEALRPTDGTPLGDAAVAKAREIGDRRLRLIADYREWKTFAQSILDQETSFRLRELYQVVKNEIAAMSAVEGYDLVLVDDSQGELAEPNPNARMDAEAQILQQILNRRILYASSVVDVTDELIDRMNNAYRRGGNP